MYSEIPAVRPFNIKVPWNQPVGMVDSVMLYCIVVVVITNLKVEDEPLKPSCIQTNNTTKSNGDVNTNEARLPELHNIGVHKKVDHLN